VSEIAVSIGQELGFAPAALRELRRAGLLHDIGKLGIPNTILDKRGPLTDEERLIVQRHPGHSEEILSRLEAFGAIADIAGAHHERLDGSGYPRGRTLDELSAPMRALAVADVFEAMTAERPYRAAMTADAALEIIRRDRGIGLCSSSVDALERRAAPELRADAA
jgi:HD-GYP domain-containing protein (c-di-GMP phosphodiesterase class II)